MRLRLALAAGFVGILLVSGCGQVTSTPTVANTGDTSPATPTMMATQTAVTGSGPQIPLPANISSHNTTGDPVTLHVAIGSQIISQQQAMAVVAKQSPWGLGGYWEGNQITVQAWYGIGTIGDARHGSQHIPLSTDETLDHIVNRSMWLLAYNNVPGIIASACWGCATTPVYTHDVYAIDAQTESILWLASYPEP